MNTFNCTVLTPTPNAHALLCVREIVSMLFVPKAGQVERLDAGRVKAVRKRRMTVRMENLSFILFSSFIGTSFLEFLVAFFEQYGIGTHPYLVKFFIQKSEFQRI